MTSDANSSGVLKLVRAQADRYVPPWTEDALHRLAAAACCAQP